MTVAVAKPSAEPDADKTEDKDGDINMTEAKDEEVRAEQVSEGNLESYLFKAVIHLFYFTVAASKPSVEKMDEVLNSVFDDTTDNQSKIAETAEGVANDPVRAAPKERKAKMPPAKMLKTMNTRSRDADDKPKLRTRKQFNFI